MIEFSQFPQLVDVEVPRPRGVGRVPDIPKALMVFFDERPTDDQMRLIHEILRDVAD